MWNWLKISYRTNKDKNFKYSVFGLVFDLNSEKLQIIWKADCFYSCCPGKSTFFSVVQDKEIMHKDEVISREGVGSEAGNIAVSEPDVPEVMEWIRAF